MGEFARDAFAFPAVVFSFALLVVIAYWLFAAVSGLGTHGDVLDGGEGIGAAEGSAEVPHGGLGGALGALGLGGVPVTVVFSLVVAVAWVVALAGGQATDAAGLDGTPALLAGCAALCLALVAGWYATWLLARPLRRLLSTGVPERRADLVGRLCTVRTGRVTAGFGQAEVPGADGGSVLVQVRAEDGNALSAGSRALIFDYDTEGEFFRVAPAPGALEPGALDPSA
ncbi:hypothetical protein SRB5_66960 [Streptomyces sp. RB5]|uniref:DUF1449 family protein n=1 Tax=Streptomyces smaragdinus TaxID=2585196 RepID=A0A7K0CSM9_9ACTN|nr:OB-fold-containig protein [Streptomyces smaragdinus]MQY16497.1 hypothetical protein [Streptomyces smaragdinus]